MRLPVLLTGALISMPLVASAANGEPYPVRPIRLIVPFPPGGGADIVARVVAPKLTESFGMSLVVDNRPGAGGSIGTETAVKAKPDGYTMILVSITYAANAALSKLPYDAVKDVAPIALVGELAGIVAVHPSLPVISIKELIAYDKANPGKLNYGSNGTGTVVHLSTELFNHMAGTTMTHVSYKGGALALHDLLGGQVQLIFGSSQLLMPHVRANRVRAIGVMNGKRLSIMPDVPTIGETVSGYEFAAWLGVLGPKALPSEIVARWNSEINRILQLSDVRERLVADGTDPTIVSPERFREVLDRDVAKLRKIVALAGIKSGP